MTSSPGSAEADDSGDDEDEGEGEGPGPGEHRDRPATRKELDELKASFKNKLLMSWHYQQDPLLPLEFKAMYWASHPLLNEYTKNLEVQRLGQEWAALVFLINESNGIHV